MIIWVVEQRDQEYASFDFLLWSLDILWSYHRLNLVELALCMYSVVNNFHSIRLALWTTEFQYLLDLVIDIFNSINAQSIASSCLLVSTRRRRQQEDDVNKKTTSTRRWHQQEGDVNKKTTWWTSKATQRTTSSSTDHQRHAFRLRLVRIVTMYEARERILPPPSHLKFSGFRNFWRTHNKVRLFKIQDLDRSASSLQPGIFFLP